jgi:hypothetical protein
MGMQGLVMVEGDHEDNDENSLLNTNITRFDKLLHIFPKLWPPINSRH